MVVSKENMILCENRNTELLMDEIFRLEPNAQITVLEDEVTEHEALLIYKAIIKSNRGHDNKTSCVYVPLIHIT